MALVTAERYNNLRQSVFSVLSTGAGDSGYGQTLTSSTVSSGNLVQASHINNIYEDIRKCYKHQNGGNPTAGQLQEVLTTDLVTDDDQTNYKGWDQYEALATNISTNRLTAHVNQIAVNASAATKTRSSSWNGTIVHVFTVTFTDEDARRYFFNSGGTIRISGSVNTGSAKDNDWNTMLSSCGTIGFGANGTTQTSGNPIGTVATGMGNYQLTASYQDIFSAIDAGGGSYSANDFKIEAKLDGTNKIWFTMTYSDDAGGNIDENVADATATIDYGLAQTDVIGIAPGFAIDGTSTL
jgi:hypothetical protein|tara:strand:+ start:1184 stop:2071 length:888 start_codon:yes stop_codon:yes gene_type:complete